MTHPTPEVETIAKKEQVWDFDVKGWEIWAAREQTEKWSALLLAQENFRALESALRQEYWIHKHLKVYGG